MTTRPLAGRAVVITGGSMGIGYACAEAALVAGANVLINARGEGALLHALERLRTIAVDRVAAFRGDVAHEADVAALFEEARRRWGEVHGVVHAAAAIGPVGPISDSDPAHWWDTVRTDLFGTYLVVRAAAGVMREQGQGKIVLLSGGGATAPFPNYSAYGCSKAAVVRLAETAAVELAPHGIDVNALAPGFVATRMHEATLAAGNRAGAEYLAYTHAQLAAGGTPPTLAAAAATFLLSPQSDGIRGRLLAAAWDDWQVWPQRVDAIAQSDLFTLRRIVPADRGLSWT